MRPDTLGFLLDATWRIGQAGVRQSFARDLDTHRFQRAVMGKDVLIGI
jgi:hypothetical protein